jgi:hypothetical protein
VQDTRRATFLYVFVAICAFLLFWNLGAYGVWDDEANAAIFAHNVWTTGDTNAYDGRNIVAFNQGLELTGIKNRVFPPLQYFYAAPFLGVFGRTAFAARLPFALAALGAFGLGAYWVASSRRRWGSIASYAIVTLTSVSLFLHSRQARYYSLAWGLTVAIGYLYVHRHRSNRHQIFLCLAGTALLATHYLVYGAVMICLGVDYVFFELRRRNDTWARRFTFLASQIAGGVAVLGVFNPIGRKVTSYVPEDWLDDKLTLFWWNLRDLNTNECLWLPFVGVATFVAILKRDLWLGRAVLALFVYALTTSVLSPQAVGRCELSDFRYLIGVFPLCIVITARTVERITEPLGPRGSVFAAVVLSLALTVTNAPHRMFTSWVAPTQRLVLRSTPLAWYGEVRTPMRSAYAESAEWLNRNTFAEALVHVTPNYALYPLIFHAPRLRYMWQFGQEHRATYPMLDAHHFRGSGVPDVIVAFGNHVNEARGLVAQLKRRGIEYEPEIWLDVRSPDQTRPEIFWWRPFETEPQNRAQNQGTFIFKRAR